MEAEPHNDRNGSWAAAIALAVVCVVAAGLRIHAINESLWLDELHTSWCVSERFSDVAPRAWIGNNSPLYFYLVWGIVQTVGQSEWSLRLPSLVAGIALVPTVFLIVKQMTGRRSAALVAAVLVAVESNNVFFSGEARPYALVQWLGAIHVWLIWQSLHGDRRWIRIAWIVVGGLLFYLHYTAALLFLAETAAVSLVRLLRLVPKQKPIGFAIDATILLLVCCVAVPQLSDIASRRENWNLFIRPRPIAEIVQVFELQSTVFRPAMLAAVGLVISYGLRVQGIARPGPARSPRQLAAGLIIVLSWLLIPILVAWITTQYDWAALFLRRYVIASGAAAAVAAGILVSVCPNRWLRLSIAAIAVVDAMLCTGPFEFQRTPPRLFYVPTAHAGQDWRTAIDNLAGALAADPRAPVLVRSGLIEADALRSNHEALLDEYCVLPVRGIYRLPETTRLFPLSTSVPADLTTEQLEAIQVHGSAWFLILARRKEASAIVGAVARRLRNASFQLLDTGNSGVWVLRLQTSAR